MNKWEAGSWEKPRFSIQLRPIEKNESPREPAGNFVPCINDSSIGAGRWLLLRGESSQSFPKVALDGHLIKLIKM